MRKKRTKEKVPVDMGFAGTPLEKEQLTDGSVVTEKWVPQLSYSWSTGRAVSKFLAELKNGKIMATKCDSCDRVLIPPRIFCEECFEEVRDWVQVKDTGKVNTFVISMIATDSTPLKEPIIAAVIDIDGSNGGILHILNEVKPEAVKMGMKVKAVWKSPYERRGDITDIKYFKPV